MATCECGAASTGVLPGKAGHADYCPERAGAYEEAGMPIPDEALAQYAQQVTAALAAALANAPAPAAGGGPAHLLQATEPEPRFTGSEIARWFGLTPHEATLAGLAPAVPPMLNITSCYCGKVALSDACMGWATPHEHHLPDRCGPGYGFR